MLDRRDSAQPYRLASLDTLRGVAILSVFAAHFADRFGGGTRIASMVGAAGHQGVQLFFLISAYTMCLVWTDERHHEGSAGRFYIKRAARIVPLYWLAIIAYVFVMGSATTAEWFWEAGLNATFLHIFDPAAINSIVPGGWSVGVEMAFYLVFPLLFALRRDILLALGLAWFVAMGIGVEAAAQNGGGATDLTSFLYFSPMTQMPVFLFGMTLHALVRDRSRVNVPAAAALIILWLGLGFAARSIGLNGRPMFWLIVLLLTGGMWATLRWNINLPPVAFFGRISYSMYLVHAAVLIGVSGHLPEHMPLALKFAVGLGLTTALAFASYRTAERWSQRIGRNLVRRLDAASGRNSLRS